MISKVTRTAVVLMVLITCFQVHAEVAPIEVEDLPAESVMPLLDSNMAVKNRAIPFSGRLELGLTTGSIIDEMFFNNTFWGLQIFYYYNEDSAWGIKYSDRAKGQSSYSDQFQGTAAKPDFAKAPAPSSLITGSYRWSFLYGKLSFSKNLVLPTVFSTETDVGVSKFGGQSLPFTSLGVSQKVFLKKHIGVGVSYRLLLYQTLDPVSKDLGAAAPTPNEDDFDKKIQISQSLELGLTYLF